MKEERLCSITKNVKKIDATGHEQDYKYVEVKGKSLNECKKYFDEVWDG